tara:strand:- start:995 stop:1990 length:996 start_codon:yes stop_codon:yes gene_type:complete
MILKKIKKSKKCFIVAEIGNNHEGNFNYALKLIDKAKAANVDAVKFQTFIPDFFISSGYSNDRFKRYQKLALSFDEFEKLSNYCKRKKIIFFSTPLDIKSAKFLNKIQKIFKIASFDLNYFELLKVVSGFQKDLIISTGFSDINKIKKAKRIINQNLKDEKLAILHCISSYPANELNLKAINLLARSFQRNIIGYSDHSKGYDASLISVALGAKIIEKHFTLDNKFSSFRDHSLSLNPKDMKLFVSKIRLYENLLGTEIKQILNEEKINKKIAIRGVYALRDLKKNEILNYKKLYFARPSGSLTPDFLDKKIIKLRRNISKNKKIQKKDIF